VCTDSYTGSELLAEAWAKRHDLPPSPRPRKKSVRYIDPAKLNKLLKDADGNKTSPVASDAVEDVRTGTRWSSVQNVN